MMTFLEVIGLFQKTEKPRIAIFRPVEDEDGRLYDALARALTPKGEVCVVDETYIDSYAALCKGLTDLIVIPSMDKVKREQFKFIKGYIERGGAVLLSASDFFMPGREVNDPFSQFDPNSVMAGEEFFKRSTAYLGIKPYRADVAPSAVCFDTDFILGPDGMKKLTVSPVGAQFNNSSNRHVPAPPVGHVFPERYEVLRNYNVVTGHDPAGRRVNAPVCFAQNWETGARLMIVGDNARGGFLDEANPFFDAIVDAAFDFSQNKIMLVSCEPEFACYRQGEAVKASCSIKNMHAEKKRVTVEMTISAGGVPCFSEKRSLEIGPGETAHREIAWFSEAFVDDRYTLCVRVTDGGRLLSKGENGFVVWSDEVARHGPNVEAAGKYFRIDGKPGIITGVNYYESGIGEMMWIKPNIAKLDQDLAQMSRDGINYIRIHYHHAKWFKDYLRSVTGTVPDYYKIPEESCLPTERILRIFDAHIYLCQKYGIIYGGDLFTLLPEEMGDPRGWYGIQDYMWFDDQLLMQKAFLNLLVPRYVKVPGIAWDIYNEPHGTFVKALMRQFDERFLRWAKEIKAHMRALGDGHMMTVGVDEPEKYDDVMDFYAEHRNYAFAGELHTNTSKPEIFQEVWLDRPPTFDGDSNQLSDMRQALLDCFRTGLSGFSPWEWTNQIRLWSDYKAYIGELWDDRLGCCVRNDGTLKPAGRFYRDFTTLLKDLTFLEMKDGVIQTPGGEIAVAAAKNVSLDQPYLAVTENGRLVRAIAKDRLQADGMTIEAQGDLWYFELEGTRYFKVDLSGTARITLDSRPAKLELCELPGSKPLGEIELQSDSIHVEPWQTYYWIRCIA